MSLAELGIKPSQYLRIFFWVMVDGVDDARSRWRGTNSYGAPPQLLISVLDAGGRKVAQGPERTIAAFGPFPWHCYYQDIWLPQQTASLSFSFKNAWNRKAQFASLSWQPISEAEATESSDAMQDPTTGTLATNVMYDGWSGHLRKLANRYPWKFLQGPSVGLRGVHHDLTTSRGLTDYFQQEALVDEDQLNHGVLYLARTYYKGNELGLLPDHMPSDWDKQLLKQVLAAQDVETGYWGTRKRPRSMGITFHLVNGLFSFGIEREGRSAVPDRYRLLPTERLPGADRIVETTLKMQARRDDGELAGWARSAYNYTGSPDRSESKASLVVTGNAIELLRRSEIFVEPAVRVQIYGAIKSAVRYILNCCLEDDGAWRQSDVDESASSDSYMFRILDKSHYLERKIQNNRPPPIVRLVGEGSGSGKFFWQPRGESPQSLRAYAPSAVAGGEDKLAAIVEVRTESGIGTDPYIVVANIRAAGERRWRSVWNPQSFLGQRLNEVAGAERILLAPGQTEFSLPLPGSLHRIRFVSADWYGEESAATELPINTN